MSDQQAPHNPLLQKLRLPGETFRLPSQGIFYQEGVLDSSVKNGEVEVFPLTTIDEIVFSTPDKLLSGKAIEEVFARCIPQVKNTRMLSSKDLDFLLVCLRMVSFGRELEVKFKHTCEEAKEHSYIVNLQKIISSTKPVDPTTVSQQYTTTIENGQVIVLKPLAYEDVIYLYETTMLRKMEDLTETESSTLIVSTLASLIRSVDGETDREMIREWVTQLPLKWKRQIEQTAHSVSEWGVDLNVQYKCKDCGETVTIQVTANPVSFFI